MRPPAVGPMTSLVMAALPTLSLLLSGGCVVGPDFVPPAPPDDSRYGERSDPTRLVAPGAGGTQDLIPGADLPDAWWLLFRSRRLDALVREGLSANPTVAQAEAALRQAQDLAQSVRAGMLPNLSGGATRSGGGGLGQGGPVSYGLYGASVAASYAPDLFGGIRRAIEAQAALEEVAGEQLRAATFALTGNIVTGAIQEATLSEQIALSEVILRQYRDQLALVKVRYDAGAEPIASVLSQESLIRSQEVTIIASRAARIQTRHRLAVLLGRLPSAYEHPSFRLRELTLPRRLPISLPSRLLEQRPDIRAAEAHLHAASAAIGVATANRLPNVTLSANLGANAATLAGLAASSVWGAGLGLTQPLFDGEALAARQAAASEGYAIALATYRMTVLNAFQNAADVLTALEADAGILTGAMQAETLAQEALAASQVQYRAGSLAYSGLLVSQVRYASATLTRLAAQSQRLIDTVALQQALGRKRFQQVID